MLVTDYDCVIKSAVDKWKYFDKWSLSIITDVSSLGQWNLISRPDALTLNGTNSISWFLGDNETKNDKIVFILKI